MELMKLLVVELESTFGGAGVNGTAAGNSWVEFCFKHYWIISLLCWWWW
jgi:hypothetical protein